MNQTQIVFQDLTASVVCKASSSCQTTLPLLTNKHLSTAEFTSIVHIIMAQIASFRVRTNHGTYFIIDYEL